MSLKDHTNANVQWFRVIIFASRDVLINIIIFIYLVKQLTDFLLTVISVFALFFKEKNPVSLTRIDHIPTTHQINAYFIGIGVPMSRDLNIEAEN